MQRLTKNLLLCIALVVWAGCDSTTEPDTVINGVDVEALFAPATPAEIAQVEAEWDQRTIAATNVRIEAEGTYSFGEQDYVSRVVSHEVDGYRHYGALFSPASDAQAPYPVLLYLHGGDSGENLDDTLFFLEFILENEIPSVVLVVPSFRSETLTLDEVTYQSDGPASLWDRDVDDALSLINVALETLPTANPDNIGVLGFSRGGGVGLLAAARDSRIDYLVEFFGPTSFFAPSVQEQARDALEGLSFSVTGFDYLNQTLIQPLLAGTLTQAEVRLELIKRSPALFPDRLPAMQLHHGEDDEIVPVEHAQVLIDALQNRSAPVFEHFLYPGAGHNPIEMTGSIPRTVTFIGEQANIMGSGLPLSSK